LISIEEALQQLLAHVQVLPEERKHPLQALGQVLAEDVAAGFDIPPLDNTAMDGYAVRAEDTMGAAEASPRELRVIGEVAAGYIFAGAVGPGTAVRIMTGAPIPEGADAVVPFEETDEPFTRPPTGAGSLSGSVHVLKEAAAGANIRRAGEDVRTGDGVLQRGTVLRPQEIGVIASLGRDEVRVIRRPVVAVLSTGDELLEPGQPRKGARIYDANGYSIAAQVRRFGGEPQLMGIAADTVEALTAKIHESLAADMLITSAGVSKRPPRPAHRSARQPRQLDGRLRTLRPAGDHEDDGQTGAAATGRARDRHGPHRERRRPSRLSGALHRDSPRWALLRVADGFAGVRDPDVDGEGERPGADPGRSRCRGRRRRGGRADAGLESGRRVGLVDRGERGRRATAGDDRDRPGGPRRLATAPTSRVDERRERRGDSAADEHQTADRGDGDERQDQTVLGEGLSVSVVRFAKCMGLSSSRT